MAFYSNIDNVIKSITNILKFNRTPVKPLPLPLIVSGVPRRSGLSSIEIANNIIARKAEAGLPVGPLPNGETNPDEIMIRIMVEEVIKAIQEKAVITVAIPPGNMLVANGVNAGGPVTVVGSTTTLHRGYGTIQ